MSALEQRLEQELGQIAARATPSAAAWEAVQAQWADWVGRPEPDVIIVDETADPPSRFPARIWIATAAALVVVAGVTGILAIQQRDDGRQAVGSTTDAAGAEADYSAIGDTERAAIEGFVAAANAGDVDAVLAAFGPGAEFGSTFVDGPAEPVPVADLGGLVGDFFRFLADRRAELTISACEPADGGAVQCRGSYTDEVVAPVDGYLSGSAEGSTLRITFAADDRGLMLLELTPTLPRGVLVRGYDPGSCPNPCRPTPWVISAGYLEFLQWIDTTHPGERALLMDDSLAYPTREDPTEDDLVHGAFPNFAPEARELWNERVGQWLAARD